MEIKAFKPEDISELASCVAETWRVDESPEFTRVFSEYLVRCNYYSPLHSWKVVDEEGLQAIAFGWMPNEENDSDEWLHGQLEGLSPEVRKYILRSSAYTKRIDTELQKMMGPHDAKLSFFFSRKAGFGHFVLGHLVEELKKQGVEWLYLWTDSWCNWQYYSLHGFEQIVKEIIPEFSDDKEAYYYYLFRKKIS